MLVCVIDLIVAAASVATLRNHNIIRHMRAILHAFLQDSTVGRPSRSRSKTRNMESSRTDGIITTLSLVHPFPFPPFLRLLSSLLVVADMQARGNGAARTKPPFHSTEFTGPAARVHTVSIIYRFTPFLSLLYLHVCTTVPIEMRCNLSLYLHVVYEGDRSFSPCYEGILNVRNQLKIKVLPLSSFEELPWTEGTFGPKYVALPKPLTKRTSAQGASDVAVMMARSGAIVFTICAYLTLLAEIGVPASRRCAWRRYAGRGAGAWRSFLIQVRYPSLLYLAYLVRGSDVTELFKCTVAHT